MNADRRVEDRPDGSGDLDLARVLLINPGDTAAERSLTRTVHADESNSVAALHVEADSLQNVQAIALIQDCSKRILYGARESVAPGKGPVNIGAENQMKILDRKDRIRGKR